MEPSSLSFEPSIYTVSQISRLIRNLLEGEFRFIRVSGEISNHSRPSSGHSYFTLKDEGAQIRAVLFKGQQRFLANELRDGAQVICHGRISVYEARGDYQLIVDTIDFQGSGLLQLQFERLKKKLASEGVFDESRKKVVPRFPLDIVLVTSATGAAVHDFLRIWQNRRWPARIRIFPVRVQGVGAADEIAAALTQINAALQTEVIVLCRGGGSLEDLWAFNEEVVARSIAESSLPVVSAIGHEIDFTLSDFCADLRAPTPTGAAEMLIPDRDIFLTTLLRHLKQLNNLIVQKIENLRQRVIHCKRILGDPGEILDHFSLHVDHLSARISHTMAGIIQEQTIALEKLTGRLQKLSPLHRLLLQEEQARNLANRLTRQIQGLLQQKAAALHTQVALLESVSPLATLARGYAITRRKTGKKASDIITSYDQTRSGDQIEILLHHGSLECEVLKALPRAEGILSDPLYEEVNSSRNQS